MDSDQEKRMAQYLLGQLSEQEQAELEKRYLADDSCFEELLAVEDDLRDAYVRSELSKTDREAFEQQLLSAPRQKQKQGFARALRERLLQSAAPNRQTPHLFLKRNSLLRVLKTQSRLVLIPAMSLILAILIMGIWWLGRKSVQPLQTRNASGAVAPTTGPPTNQAPPVQTQRSPESPEPEGGTIAVVLSPGLVRGGDQNSRTVVISPDVSRVRLEARFEGDYPSYEAVLQTAENKRIWSEGSLKLQTFRGGKRVLLYISSSLLQPGDYILTLRGLPAAGNPETVAEYSFRVKLK
jgi:hypothetical protein